MEDNKTREQIRLILKECILNQSDKSKIKSMFEELMQDKPAWDKFLRIVIPSVGKALGGVTEEAFDEFKRITFEEIDKWNPKQ